MIFRRKRREVPGLNTTSTADISFMLLVFFLVTTSMDVDKGMNRQLPPKQDEKQEMMDVDRSKVMSLSLSEEGLLTIDEKPANIDKVRRQLKEFIVSTGPSHIIEISGVFFHKILLGNAGKKFPLILVTSKGIMDILKDWKRNYSVVNSQATQKVAPLQGQIKRDYVTGIVVDAFQIFDNGL